MAVNKWLKLVGKSTRYDEFGVLKGETEIIRALMEDHGVTQAELAKRAGYKSQSNVSKLLRSKHMSAACFLRLLSALDMRLGSDPRKDRPCAYCVSFYNGDVILTRHDNINDL